MGKILAPISTPWKPQPAGRSSVRLCFVRTAGLNNTPRGKLWAMKQLIRKGLKQIIVDEVPDLSSSHTTSWSARSIPS